MTNEICESIIRAYNGDDAYIFQELNNMDKFKKGKINESDFVQFFMKTKIPQATFTENDLHFLAQHYMNQKISKTELDYSSFHTDLKRIKQQLGIQGGMAF